MERVSTKYIIKECKEAIVLNLIHVFNFHFRMPPNQMALYPNWLIVYVLRVIVPMLILFFIAVKTLLKSGREIQRAFYIKDVTSLDRDAASVKKMGRPVVIWQV